MVAGSSGNPSLGALPTPASLMMRPTASVSAFNAGQPPLTAIPPVDTLALSSAQPVKASSLAAATPPAPLMFANPFAAAAPAAFAAAPQVMYVPVLQAPSAGSAQPSAPAQEAPDLPSPNTEPATRSKPPAEMKLEANFPERLSGELPTPQEVGYMLGKAVEHILTSNPEFLEQADRMELDDPQALVTQVHETLRPAVAWMPNAVSERVVKQLPLEKQEMADRFIKWLDTPTAQLKPLTDSGVAPKSTSRPMNAHKPEPKSKSSDPLDSLLNDESPSRAKRAHHPDSKRSAKDDPLADLFAEEPVKDEKPSLRERLNPFSHLPGRKDKEPTDPFADLSELMI